METRSSQRTAIRVAPSGTSAPSTKTVAHRTGGYSREEADQLLARNPHLIASFSRALTEGLRRDQSDAEFDEALDKSIASIYAASLS